MKTNNEKQLLATGVYEAPKCEVIEMMGEGSLLTGSVGSGEDTGEWQNLRGRFSDSDDEDYD